MKIFMCNKCNSKDIFIKETATRTGLYCADCGSWLKWLGKEEKRLAERQIELQKSKSLFTGDEVLFLGFDIHHVTKTFIERNKERITQGMTENELKAYDLGVVNTLAILDMSINSDVQNVDYIIHIPFKTFDEEYIYKELYEMKKDDVI